MQALEEVLQAPRLLSASPTASRSSACVALGALGCGSSASRHSLEPKRALHADYEELFGPSSLPLPSSLESSRWFQALKLSPRYMDDGVREAAMELLSSPAVAYSMALSMMLYMAAWAAPEPVFSKAFAGAVTLWLLMTYTAVELHTVGKACLDLYREAEATRSVEELEAVAARFGRAIGGVGLRVLVTVAGTKLASSLPEVPKGGMWARLSPPRFAFTGGGAQGGFTVGAGTRAQVSVADGTVVLMGVTANTVASAASKARTTGARAESKMDDNPAHHIATDKNDTSEVSGGPWTPRFKALFDRAGMSLDAPANILYLRNHKGPHPEDYHAAVYKRLQGALEDCQTQAECSRRIMDALDEIAGEICTPGSRLHKLATKTR
ncbi:MAG TPA: AHH domain-containing protein [Archangium sp.]|nr:AHH domain-containing protein [Archangium sp.]